LGLNLRNRQACDRRGHKKLLTIYVYPYIALPYRVYVQASFKQRNNLMSTKMAILVGLRQVSTAAYGGWDGRNGCEGCELDVDNMGKILTPLGYEIHLLKTANATKTNILTQLEFAAQALTAGDKLVFYFAGHGGQQPDQNGDELDAHDETLLAYDGEILDDQLNVIWPKFQAGVRIVMLSDSCNSGTNYRALRTVAALSPILPVDRDTTEAMVAQMIHMGGCRDGFTSSGYVAGGAFTMALATIWNGGAFAGTYAALHQALVAAVTSGQSPQYNEYGPVTEEFRNERAFVSALAPDIPTTPLAPIPAPRQDSQLSEENQRLLIEAYLRLLDQLGAGTPALTQERAVTGRQLVYVHGISTHVGGYSNPWWAALKSYTTLFGAGALNGTRYEVLWSNLVNSRAAQAMAGLPGDAPREAQEAESLRVRIQDVLEDRQRQQAAPLGRTAAASGAARGLDMERSRGFTFDDFLVYMVNGNMRQQVINRFTQIVRPLLAAGAEVDIIAHSWGTVVAYEGLRELENVANLGGRVTNFFTVGSALSLPPVRSSLRFVNRDGQRPSMVEQWINVDAQGDLVGGSLADMFAVDDEKLELIPTGCQKNWGWYNLACAHASYFHKDNQLVNQDIFANFING